MKLYLLLFSLFFTFNITFSQQLNLSEDAEVSVLTFGPGASLNDAFGHNAFRIKDENQRIDFVFGYGDYDFNAPNFYLKFAQGKLNYLLSKNRYQNIYNYYTSQNRTIKEQVLNLSTPEKQAIFNFLEDNYKPSNRRYLYDFFYDNCATKMRDVLLKTVDNNINFKSLKPIEKKTFRGLIHEHVNRNSWGSFGIDLALGSVIDNSATEFEYMYLPKYIFDSFEGATLSNGERLVKESKTVYKSTKNRQKSSFLTSPLFILGLLALVILVITYFDYKNHKRTKWLDIILFAVTGLIGVFMLLLWFATDHTATAFNYNLLWAFPLNILVTYQLFKTKVNVWFTKYLKFLVILLCLLTLHWLIGVQVYAIALIPLLLALGIRYLFLLNYFKL